MKIYWLYNLPTCLSGTLTVIAFVAFGLAGLYLFRRWVQRLDSREHHAYNHIVGFYLAGVTVLYAVCAGLLAIGAWATFSEVQGKIDHEATALGALYRDIGAYPEPARTILQNDQRRYARQREQALVQIVEHPATASHDHDQPLLPGNARQPVRTRAAINL